MSKPLPGQPRVSHNTPPCFSYLGFIQSLFFPPRSMALQRTAGAPRLRRSSSLRLTADPVLQEREEGGFTAVPPISTTWLAVSPALQKCLESKLKAYQGISAAGSET